MEVLTYLNKKKFEFVIENLYRGSMINQNSFLLNDELDTDCRCATAVTLYTMTIETLKELRRKHVELDGALEAQETFLIQGNRRELAIDYSIEDPYSHVYWLKNKQSEHSIHNYVKE